MVCLEVMTCYHLCLNRIKLVGDQGLLLLWDIQETINVSLVMCGAISVHVHGCVCASVISSFIIGCKGRVFEPISEAISDGRHVPTPTGSYAFYSLFTFSISGRSVARFCRHFVHQGLPRDNRHLRPHSLQPGIEVSKLNFTTACLFMLS